MGVKLQRVKHKGHLTEWAEMVRECRCSGMTIRNWCRENSLNEKTYYYRQKQVCDAIPEISLRPLEQVHGAIPQECAGAVQFAEIGHTNMSAAAVHIRIGKAEISVDSGSDLALLRDVMRIAAEIC